MAKALDLGDFLKGLDLDSPPEEVIEKCSALLDEDDTNTNLLIARAYSFAQKAEYTEALSDCHSAIQLDQELEKAWALQGEIYFSIKSYTEALKSFQKASELSTSGSVDHTNLEQWVQKCLECGAEVEIESAEQAGSESMDIQSEPMRFDWYQSDAKVTITLWIKQVQEDELQIDISSRQVRVKVQKSDSLFINEFHLWRKINADEAKFKRLKTKIEIHLPKLEPVQWASLEGEGEGCLATKMASTKDVAKDPLNSSKWDKMVSNIIKDEEKEKPEGDEALNKLLKQVYGNGSEEQQRAMMKSFYESGGTVLSTNWDEVGQGKVEAKPPDGAEFKQWSS